MADPKATIYDVDPHARAKHQILQEYLKWERDPKKSDRVMRETEIGG